MKRLGVLLLFSTALVMGQARFSAPALGHVYDPGARAIRSISGVPGAAGFDHILGTDLDTTSVSPGRDYALSRGLQLIRWSGEDLSRTSLDSAGTQLDNVAFSHSGEVAAIYYGDSGIIEVWAGLPAYPRLAFRTHQETRLTALAVTDDASAVIGVGKTGLVLITSDASRPIATGEYTDVAFLGASMDAVAADSALNQVLIFRNLALASVLAGPSEGVDGPVALGISGDNRKVVVANRGSDSVLQVDLESRNVTKVACECKPDVMQRLQGNAIFRITETFKTKLFVLDGDAPEPRVFLVTGGTQ